MPLDHGADRPARIQLIVALVLGLALVAIPLYLWRRPRAEALGSGTASDVEARPAVAVPPPPPPASETKVVLSEPKILLCQDPGAKKTPPSECDHLPAVEAAFAKAIAESSSCLPKDGSALTIGYVANVSFKRKAIDVTIAKEGRTLKNLAMFRTCQANIKSALMALPLDSTPHAHARYRIEIQATYPASPK